MRCCGSWLVAARVLQPAHAWLCCFVVKMHPVLISGAAGGCTRSTAGLTVLHSIVEPQRGLVCSMCIRHALSVKLDAASCAAAQKAYCCCHDVCVSVSTASAWLCAGKAVAAGHWRASGRPAAACSGLCVQRLLCFAHEHARRRDQDPGDEPGVSHAAGGSGLVAGIW